MSVALVLPSMEAQSLWHEGQNPKGFLLSDNVARNLGDIVTVIIKERQLIKDGQDVTMDKSNELDAKVTSLDVNPRAFSTLPAMGYSSKSTFGGKADFSRDGRFETLVSAQVIDVQPNGNLVVEGRRVIRLDDEVKTIRVSGIVRPQDLSPENTVLSENVANAEISYQGDGPLSQATRRGWFSRFLEWIWPF
ncbi:MAG: flagellar basal body L-ring protein FlgH [Planctomycetota bacterium]